MERPRTCTATLPRRCSMARRRASMREGPLAELFRATEAAQRQAEGQAPPPAPPAEEEVAAAPPVKEPEERTVELVPSWEESTESAVPAPPAPPPYTPP